MVATLRWIGIMLGSTLAAVLVLGASAYVALVAWDRAHPPTLPGFERDAAAAAKGLPPPGRGLPGA